MVQWLGLHASTAGGAWAQALVRELRSRKQCMTKKEKKNCPWLLNRYEAPIPSSPKPIASQVDLCDHFTLGSLYQMISFFFFFFEK